MGKASEFGFHGMANIKILKPRQVETLGRVV
jgi:hypothetical protein